MSLKNGNQFSSVAQSCPTLCDPVDCSTAGLPVHCQLPGLPKLMSIESVMLFNHLTLCHPLLLLPSIFPSIRIFSNESVLRIRWPSVGTSASSSVLPMNIQDSFPIGLPGLISLQSKGSKALTLWCLAFFMVQLSHPYMTIGKAIPLSIWTFVGKVMSLLFNMLPRLVIALLPRSTVF